MKLRIVSDLHLEFDKYTLPEAPDEAQSVLILAGDICVADSGPMLLERFKSFFEDVSRRFRQVMYVPGNHEHYDGSIVTTPRRLKRHINEWWGLNNVRILANDWYLLEDDDDSAVAFIGSTLWTDCGKNDPLAMLHWDMMSDSRKIRTGPSESLAYDHKFNIRNQIQEHQKAVLNIFDSLETFKAIKRVVITHHAPSWQSIHPSYEGDNMNMFYASHLDDRIFDANPEFWFHGHVHNSFDYLLDPTKESCQTRIIANPRGYPNHSGGQENKLYNPFLTVEV